jgi:hypothetical protein
METTVQSADEITSEEIDLCLEAISRHPKGAEDIGRPPGEVHTIGASTERYIYINFIQPADVPIGAIYRTWIVQFTDGRVARVLYFRSRRGAFGDDTLPDDD